MPEGQIPWVKRMASSIANATHEDNDNLSDAIEAALEAAGEMKCLRLKMILGRAFKVIRLSCETKMPVNLDDDFLDHLRDELS